MARASVIATPTDLPARACLRNHVVAVVNDDPQARQAQCNLFRSAGADVVHLESAEALSDWVRPDRPCCVVLDVPHKGLSGPGVQAILSVVGHHTPIIFLTSPGDTRSPMVANTPGAEHFLCKPFSNDALLGLVSTAVSKDAQRAALAAHVRSIKARYDLLTPREKEVIGYVTTGLANKQIAGLMSISEITVKIHRSHVMRKMQAGSLAMLVLLAHKIGVCAVGS